jgi:5,10-methylenetetrahydromethanopterin reductase
MVQFGLELVPDTSINKLANYATSAEEAGFDNIWVTDHYNNHNVYIVLEAMAASTEKVKMGPGITNPYLVHPAWTASAIASLNETSNGRAILGLGPGDKMTLDILGVGRDKPLGKVREATEVIRKLLREKRVSYDGAHFKLTGASLRNRPERDIPIYLGAQGPKMLELASSIGDGILINASHPKDFEYAFKHIEKGTNIANRDLANIDVAAYTCISIDYDVKKAKKKVLPVVAFIVAGSAKPVLNRHEIQEEDFTKVKNAMASGDFARAFNSVTDEMVNAFSIVGTPAECTTRIEKLLESGVTQFVAGSPIGPKKSVAIKLFADEVIPQFK